MSLEKQKKLKKMLKNLQLQMPELCLKTDCSYNSLKVTKLSNC